MKPLMLLLLFLCCGCSKSHILEQPKTRASDTTTYTIPADTLELSDVPIGFEVEVEEWEETNL